MTPIAVRLDVHSLALRDQDGNKIGDEWFCLVEWPGKPLYQASWSSDLFDSAAAARAAGVAFIARMNRGAGPDDALLAVENKP